MNLKQMHNRADYYQIITGTLSELEVFDTQAQFFKSRKLAGLPAAGLLALGDAAAAASQLSTADDNEEATAYLNSVQYFRCKVGNIVVEGLFCRAFFTDGDQVEVVAEPRNDGSYFAYALRRPIDHRLWLHPFAMKGTAIGKREAFRYAKYFFLFLTIILNAMSLYICWEEDDFFFLSIAIPALTFGSFIFSAFIYFFMKSGLNKGSKIADKIFATLGYPKPKEVDMEQEFMEFYFNNKSEKDPDFYVDITTKQYKQDADGVKWVTFYREAPPIPDYITVINTESKNNEAKTDT
ncbi:putative type VI secretion system effector [Orbus sturtevantii]|uniref:putative type VI secretion system effector n=1 Tax=Orbus sturtevantii TaxID=3074109 RepID=UPI00370DADA5